MMPEKSEKPQLRVVKRVKAKKLDTEDLITRFEFEIERGRAPSVSALYNKSEARQELFNRGGDKATVRAINTHLFNKSFDPGVLFDCWARLRDEINAAYPDLKPKVRKPSLKRKPLEY